MPAPSDRLRETYERRARLEYARPTAVDERGRKFELIWTAVSEALPCEAFLDAGCGDGRYLAALARIGGRPRRIVGSDISERILETAAAATAQSGVQAELVRANVEELPFPDGSFDLVLCTQVIEHLLDPGRGVAELARVLRPGGTLVLSTDNAANWISRILNGPRRVAVTVLGLSQRRLRVHFPHADFAPDELRFLATSAGLEVRRIDTARFHFDGALGRSRRLQAALDSIDRALGAHGYGDIVLAVCTR
jgi:2-polyprenyl-3-methyl-5-hydroxy-6-metoxy-1,4-benzoquinol methylase